MVMYCVYNNVMNCIDFEKVMVKEVMDFILSLFGSYCKVDMEGDCNIIKVLVDQFILKICDMIVVDNCLNWYNNVKDYYVVVNNIKVICR